MKTTTTVMQMWVRGAGVLQLLLGLIIWTGNADGLIRFHILLGISLVLALWTLAVLGAVARVSGGLVALAILWGIIVTIVGLTQEGLLPGSAHWVLQVVHLLLGLGLIGQGENLARRIKHNLSVGQTTPRTPSFEGAAR